MTVDKNILYWFEYESITEKTLGLVTKHDRRKTRWAHYKKNHDSVP